MPEKPKRRGPLKLERQRPDAGAPLHFVHEKFSLPHAGETFVGTLARNLDGAVQVTADNADAIQTLVCFDVTKAAPPADGKLRMTCREGQRCVPEVSIVVPCGGACTASAWRWTGLIPSAMAQASAPTAAARPAPGDWIVPRLETLRERRGTPQAVAFSDVTLTLSLPPHAPAADEATYDIRINGRKLWVNGLPAWTHGSAFKAGVPLQLAFGLENLDSAGKYNGRERVEVRIILLRDKHAVFEDSVAFDFFALRDQDEQAATSASGQPVRWAAKYSPAAADRYQIFAYGGGEADTLAAKEKMQQARVPSSTAAGALPLVGVVRPPNRNNKSWGVAVGVAQASGQVRFSFDGATTKALCAWMAEDAPSRRFRSQGFAAPPTYRVREIAVETNDATARKPTVECSVFGKA